MKPHYMTWHQEMPYKSGYSISIQSNGITGTWPLASFKLGKQSPHRFRAYITPLSLLPGSNTSGIPRRKLQHVPEIKIHRKSMSDETCLKRFYNWSITKTFFLRSLGSSPTRRPFWPSTITWSQTTTDCRSLTTTRTLGKLARFA